MTLRWASRASGRSSLAKIELMCFSTARSLKTSLSATAALLLPWAIREHLALPWGEAGEGDCVASERAATSVSTTLGSITDPPPATTRIAGQELVQVGQPFLQEIGATLGAVLEEGQRIGGVGVLAEQDHAGRRPDLAEAVGRPDALVGAGGRHADIGEEDLRLGAGDGDQQRVVVLADSHQVDRRLALEQPPHPLADKIAVLGEDDLMGTKALLLPVRSRLECTRADHGE